MSTLHTLKPNPGSTSHAPRVGRGNASGHGAYSGRGIKGQRARSGGRRHGRKRGLKQMLLQLPKTRGFQSPHDKSSVVNVGQLASFPAGAVITPSRLLKQGIIRSATYVKVLAMGSLKVGLEVHAHAFSATAKAAIEKAGGKTVTLTVPHQPLPARQLAKQKLQQ